MPPIVARLEVETAVVPVVQGSPRELGQVLVNLLVNAMQAMPDQPPSESIVGVRLAPADEMGWVKLQVYDNGEGIQEDLVDRVFDPFFTTKTQGGTGLGLAIVKQAVQIIDFARRAAVVADGGRRGTDGGPRAELPPRLPLRQQ